ncbi:MAG TPA: radical SAM protein [Candidatus Nitrosocosmicus sp.]|nr:radical SAM protein [Candidatus Nitrosocosmicus sp.]
MRYFVKTFGCQQNHADSERVASTFEGRGFKKARSYADADYVVINTCMVRQSAENRVYGLVENLKKYKEKNPKYKIIVTGCMVGVAFRDKTGKFLQRLKTIMPAVDEFMPIEEVGFDNAPLRTDNQSAWVPISNGCNNFCTFCIVPFTRGREISRPYEDIIKECLDLKEKGFKHVTLLGQNVNSYGADLIVGEKNIQVMRDIDKKYFESNTVLAGERSERGNLDKIASSITPRNDTYTINGRTLKPIYVKHLGRLRIPTLFPYLLEEVAQMGFESVNFISSNPWDFSNELIDVIARNENISRTLHIAVQSGDNNVLKRMNRWYTREEFIQLANKLKLKIKNLKLTTDIIVGFCGETDEEFENTYDLCQKVDFDWAYIARYSVRPMTAATKVFQDDVPAAVKKARWDKLDALVNKPKLSMKYQREIKSLTSLPNLTA